MTTSHLSRAATTAKEEIDATGRRLAELHERRRQEEERAKQEAQRRQRKHERRDQPAHSIMDGPVETRIWANRPAYGETLFKVDQVRLYATSEAQRSIRRNDRARLHESAAAIRAAGEDLERLSSP